ncbi:MAG: ribulokinase [Bacteroidetes bacterium]|nr:ribulokinase [Bacteroidota bacterium]MBU1115223.1 ribulokinase [Bacteroidota bacterium]MBU1797241.1 ribulokinase [Bacteroidota bacterium]
MSKYAIGLDYGTNSCRSLIVDISNGKELASHVFSYPSGEMGVIVDKSNPNLARQNPADYIKGIEVTITEALKKIKGKDANFNTDDIVGIGVDTTGSSPMLIDSEGKPLCFSEKFRDNNAAMVWLWKDHTSFKEAESITKAAKELRPEYLAKIGGVYSSEWFWSKLLKCAKDHEDVFDAADSFIEICDWIPAVLVGDTKPENIKRSVCAAGHKAMFSNQWGGLPDEEFLNYLSPKLGEIRNKLFSKSYPSEEKMGNLSAEWAAKLGLSTNVAVAVGAFDAHMGAVGAGVKEGTLVKILGTSTCDIMISPNEKKLKDIPGVCGIVDGSVKGGYYGIEAGQSAVGDIFLWFVNNLVPDSYGKTQDEKFETLETKASELKPGESGLLALDWNNGNRTILVDVRLTGLLLGQTLQTEPHEIYRALVEATAFGALAIIDRIAENGVPINEVVNCGGLAIKNSMLMQIYADITNRPMKVSASEQTPALGAAIFGSVAAGEFNNVEVAQSQMTGIDKSYNPISENHIVYKELYKLYKRLHDGFGVEGNVENMYNVMKDLLDIRDRVRRDK